ncbi:MAG: hypothetical protein FWG42_10835 [Clostridiales bacterium]|nr:hypothetical protein [Clostridiales bacterium]
MKKHTRKGKAALCLALALCLVFPLGLNANVFAHDDAASSIGIEYSEDGGAIWLGFESGLPYITMSDQKRYRATISLNGATEAEVQALIDDGLTWELTRAAGLLDEYRWPYQWLGGLLFKPETGSAPFWSKFNSTDALFSLATVSAVNTGDTVDEKWAIQMEFANGYLFGTQNYITRENGNSILDFIGNYNLVCRAKDNSVLGKTEVRYTPYASFRTQMEVDAELDAAVEYVNGFYDGEGMYAEKIYMGDSAGGRPMHGIIITDSEATLANYQSIKNNAQETPALFWDALNAKSGDLFDRIVADYKTPILYSNLHSDEFMGVDGVLDFMWALIKSHENNGKIDYTWLDDFTLAGKEQLQKVRAKTFTAMSSLLYDDPSDPATAWSKQLGYLVEDDAYPDTGEPLALIRDMYATAFDLDLYYETSTKSLNVKTLLDEVFFILVPSENVDGRVGMWRGNDNGYDLNRDHMFQTQPETANMMAMIQEWNPIAFFEFHGYHNEFMVEPCTPPHEGNMEYDLYAKNATLIGEAFGIAGAANNELYHAYKMPLRDHFIVPVDGAPYWLVWDDSATNYTPSASMLHGTLGITVETVAGNTAGVDSLVYGMVGAAAYAEKNRLQLLQDQIEFFRRGVENIDAKEKMAKYYVDYNDRPGVEANIFRPIFSSEFGNGKYFPEYYVIPLGENQKNLAAANDMIEYFIRNGVLVNQVPAGQGYTVKDVRGTDKEINAGDFIISMYQAKRNVANAALNSDRLVTNWPGLYSEPTTAFGHLRGFDFYTIGVGKAPTAALGDNTAEFAATLFTGAENGHAIIRNSGLEAIKAINCLLGDGEKVGFITEGADKGHFVVPYSAYEKVKDAYVLTVEGVSQVPAAKVIAKLPSLYIPGMTNEFDKNNFGQPYGVRDYTPTTANAPFFFDKHAFGAQMGFDVTWHHDPNGGDISDVDVIIGATLEKGATSIPGSSSVAQRPVEDYNNVVAAVKAGKPYVSIGASLNNIRTEFFPDDMAFIGAASRSTDHLFRTEYVSDSLITDNYKYMGTDTMYGFGGYAILTAPEGSNVLIKAADENPLMGCILASDLDKFKNSIQAFEYNDNGLDITVFANTLTRKTHQQGDYMYAANAIYSKVLGEDYAELSDDGGLSGGLYIDPVSYISKDIEFTVSLENTKDVLAVELEFEIDGSKLAGKGILGLNEFVPMNGILWIYVDNDKWRGAVTLALPSENTTGLTSDDAVDIAKFIFAPKGFGNATMAITSFRVVGLDETTVFLDPALINSTATTIIARSKYDLNRDGVVDALDLGIMLLYCGFDADASNWGDLVKVGDAWGNGVTASMCDVNGDGLIDMLDLLDLFIHYTK